MGRCRGGLFGVALLATTIGFAARAQPRQVNGVLGGSVLLSPLLPRNKTVKEIEWSFSAGAGATIQVAEFGPGGFKRPDPKDRFKERLEMFNATALKIRALERGDSGVYGARIKLHPALVEDQSFNLSVYGPGVPWRSGDDPSTWPASAGTEGMASGPAAGPWWLQGCCWQPTPPGWSFPKSLRGTVPNEEGCGDSSDLHARLR
ncbi:uncharacterized protein LOC128901019 isoform X2 [Rissa tridactyla]|uniref:uncharacterized protein LOC128901019 isoform X2 n=1 Tax=Rissa tridactyla TaxID=75485 RepID=UPI0023BAC7D7|nr:uncharacterized protein LOC128901019 isoform X2 [Rissa tridactyla]